MTIFKAQALIRGLQQNLMASIAGLTVAQQTDANGYPVIYISANGENQFIDISDEPTDRINSLGLPQFPYTPELVQILRSTTITDKNSRAQAEAYSFQLGCKVEIWEIAVLPASFTTSGATLVATLVPDPYNKLTNQI
jgi:hypothetical protein